MKDPRSSLLTKPWGLQIMRKVLDSNHRGFEANEEQAAYWTNRYRIEGVICLQQLIEWCITDEVLSKIEQPVFIAYYPDDSVVSVPKMEEFMEKIKTPNAEKKIIGLASTEGHSLISKYYSKDLAMVLAETVNFANTILD